MSDAVQKLMERLEVIRARQEEEKMAEEAKKQEPEFKNVTVAYAQDPEAKQIVLPGGMSLKKGAEWLMIQDRELDKEVSLHYPFPGYYPVDAALALYKALTRTYGFTGLVDTPPASMFEEKKPPVLVGVEVSPGHTVQIPWGAMVIHGIKGRLESEATLVDGQPVFVLGGTIVQRDRHQVDKIVALAKEILRTESIYRGKAIKVDLPPRHLDLLKAPKFMEVNDVQEGDLIFPRVVQQAVETNIFVPIKHTAVCRAHDIPRRRGILLAGPYGTGKTLTALVTAKLCVNNGWTFIYVDNLEQLPQALHFAKQYAPSVVFGEDINRVVSGDRDEDMDEYFNVLDGVDRKKDEVMVIFTTNEVDEIHPGMMRPGRIDAIIPVEPPDAEATTRLVRVYGRGLLDPDADLTLVGRILAGQIPAVVREAVERAKLVAIGNGSMRDGKIVVFEADLVSAAEQLVQHAEYVNREYEGEKPDMQILGEAIGGAIRDALGGKQRWENEYGAPDPDDGDTPYGGRGDEPETGGEAIAVVVKDALDKAGRPKRNGKKQRAT